MMFTATSSLTLSYTGRVTVDLAIESVPAIALMSNCCIMVFDDLPLDDPFD